MFRLILKGIVSGLLGGSGAGFIWGLLLVYLQQVIDPVSTSSIDTTIIIFVLTGTGVGSVVGILLGLVFVFVELIFKKDISKLAPLVGAVMVSLASYLFLYVATSWFNLIFLEGTALLSGFLGGKIALRCYQYLNPSS